MYTNSNGAWKMNTYSTDIQYVQKSSQQRKRCGDEKLQHVTETSAETYLLYIYMLSIADTLHQ